MIRFGWIAKYRDKQDRLDEVFNFFDVTDQEQWSAVWENCQVNFRQAQRVDIHLEAVSEKSSFSH